MSQRKKRLDKLIAHRQRELDLRMATLSQTRATEQQVSLRLDHERKEVDRAQKERERAISGSLSVKSFVEANDFLMTCMRRREIVEVELVRAARRVQKAQADVLAAKNDLKKIELLSERLQSDELRQADRVEQRLTDEISARKSADTQKRRSET